MGKDDYCIWNATNRKIVFRPVHGVEIVLFPFPGMVRLNRAQFETIIHEGFFTSLQRRGQVSTSPIGQAVDQRTNEKSAPDELQPKKGPQGKNKITHTVQGVNEVVEVPAAEGEGNPPKSFGNKGGNKR